MNKILLTAVSAAACLSFVACRSVDLSGVESRLDDLDKRTTELEKTVRDINRDIEKIDKLIQELSANTSITNVTYNMTSVVLEFSDGQKIEIETGSDGAPAPVIGVKLYNGRYWWTLTFNGKTDWLLDDDGNMMPVDGRDGKDGKDGADAPQGSNVVIKPLLSVDADGYWIVSYDDGKTFSRMKDAKGADMPARPVDASAGGGTCLFKACENKDDSVVLTLVNGEQLVFEKFFDVTIKFEKTEDIDFTDDRAEVAFTIEGDTRNTSVISLDKGSVKSEIVMKSADKGVLKVTRSGRWQYSSRVIVLLITPNHTITTLLTFHATDMRIDESLTLEVTERFELNMMDINRGFNPPLVSGTYLAKPFTCLYCSYTDKDFHNITGETMTPRIFRFTEQSIDGEIKVDFVNDDRTYHLGERVFNICGNAKLFTAYSIVETRDTLDLDNIVVKKSVYVISGQKEASTVKNLKFGEYIITKSYDKYSYYMPEGTCMTFKASTASSTEWPENL